MTLTLNLNSLFQGTVSFHPSLVLEINQTHETAFFFIHLLGLEGPPTHPVSKTRAFCMNVNMTAYSQNQSDPFVKKQPGVQHEGEFGEGGC